MNFKPMADRVLVRQAASETTTASGFIIPDAMIERANRGTILAVGPGTTTKNGQVIPMPLAVDDQVMFSPGAGIRVKIEGEEMLVLKEEELIAIVD